jgi:4-hydroxybenzoate polyprenyltransferase
VHAFFNRGRAIAHEAAFLLKSARPGFWMTTIWFYFLPLGGEKAWLHPGFWLGLAAVTFPLGLIIYGWNDLVDADTDQFNPRKNTYLFGARPTPEQRLRLPWWIAAVQMPFAVLIAQRIGLWQTLAWYGTVAVAVGLYNQKPFSCKSRPPLEILCQAGYLTVFVLSSWLNEVPQLAWPAFVFGALFAMHSHLFGEIMDITPDTQAGRCTTAVLLGPVKAKCLAAALLFFEAGWVWHYFGSLEITGFLALSALCFVMDATVLWRARPYTETQMRAFFLGWNAVAVVSLPWIWAQTPFHQLVVHV